MESPASEILPFFVSSKDEAVTVKKTFEQKSGISYNIFRTYAGNLVERTPTPRLNIYIP